LWDDPARGQQLTQKLSRLKAAVEQYDALRRKMDDVVAMDELLEDADDPDLARELAAGVESLAADLEKVELAAMLSGEYDANDAIATINAGAGGTESQDWAEMLLRMYMRWGEEHGFKVEVDEIHHGEEAGIKSAIFQVHGPNAYGFLSAERGVHRLVRISPFYANKRRHTSFCAVDVIAEVNEEIDIEIPDSEIRVDVYRSSGKGGQGVNTTDSAVRLTHIPSGIVVVCQNERSQIKNRATALNVLKSRLYEKKQDEQRAEMDKFYGEKGEIGWGSQIRSYVLQPYQMVKDLRTGVSTSDTQAVLDGDLDRFVNAWLRAGCPRHRNKDIQMEE
jgi:peptide chain release factor 2